jgi:RNA polymerase sigma-70 factor, ECF subfamily
MSLDPGPPRAERTSSGEVTQLLGAIRAGDNGALSRLLSIVYPELRRLAAREFRRERRDHTLQPTALVHEVYLRLLRNQRIQWIDRAHFFAVSARLMRRILVDHARGRAAQKRGGAQPALTLDGAGASPERDIVDLIALDAAMGRLAERDGRQARVVELRVFGGLNIEETAEVLIVSASTVKNDWRMARAWLSRELSVR